MSDKEVGLSRAVRVADFSQYVKDKKATEDKAWEADRERIRLLDEGDRRYYAELEARSRAALKKHLEGVGQRQTGAPEGQVLK